MRGGRAGRKGLRRRARVRVRPPLGRPGSRGRRPARDRRGGPRPSRRDGGEPGPRRSASGGRGVAGAVGLGARGRGRRWGPPPPSRAHVCSPRRRAPAARGPASHLSLPPDRGDVPRAPTAGTPGGPVGSRCGRAEAGACPRAVALRGELWAAGISSCGPRVQAGERVAFVPEALRVRRKSGWEPRGSSLEVALVRGAREPGFGEGLRRVQGHTARCTARLSHLVARRWFLGGEGPGD